MEVLPWQRGTPAAYMYKGERQDHEIFFNKETLAGILTKLDVGSVAQLLPNERNLRPDITDVTDWIVFEIKPLNDQGLREGLQAVHTYLMALNRSVAPDARFAGGVDFHGEILIRFAQGQYIWRLQWLASAPGLIQYEWTRSQRTSSSEVEAFEIGRWVNLTEEEMKQYGGWVAQAVDGMVDRRDFLNSLSGRVGIVIEVFGQAAMGFFSGVMLGHMGSGSTPGEPPARGGGQVLPFPVGSGPSVPPARVPAAAMGR